MPTPSAECRRSCRMPHALRCVAFRRSALSFCILHAAFCILSASGILHCVASVSCLSPLRSSVRIAVLTLLLRSHFLHPAFNGQVNGNLQGSARYGRVGFNFNLLMGLTTTHIGPYAPACRDPSRFPPSSVRRGTARPETALDAPRLLLDNRRPRRRARFRRSDYGIVSTSARWRSSGAERLMSRSRQMGSRSNKSQEGRVSRARIRLRHQDC
jgi:hypothetical protein